MSSDDISQKETISSGSDPHPNVGDLKQPTQRLNRRKSGDVRVKSVENILFAQASHKQNPSPWTKSMFKLYALLLVPLIAACVNGYCGTVIQNVNTYASFREYFGFDPEVGVPYNGFVSSSHAVGAMIGNLVAGPAADVKGRRWGMIFGGFFIIIAAIIEASATSLPQFTAGRLLVGVGLAFCVNSSVVYASEIVHPCYRGTPVALLNMGWQIASIISSQVPWSSSWRVPLYLQIIFPGIVAIGAYFIPESPRWLIANNRHAEALKIMGKYHGEGDSSSPIVQLEYTEMTQDISADGADKHWWDYRALFSSREARYRTMQVVAIGFIGQWTGNVQEMTHESLVLPSVGLASENSQRIIHGIFNVTNFIGSVIGAFLTDLIGRRKQFIPAALMFAVIFVIVMPLDATSVWADGKKGELVAHSVDRSRAILFFTYLFGWIFALTYTPLQLLYPVESLRYETRAKGYGVYGFCCNAAGFYKTFVTTIATTEAGWKYMFLFIFWNIATAIFMYFYFVETRNRTLEELTEIFSSKYPVKTSLAKSQVVVQDDAIILYDSDEYVD